MDFKKVVATAGVLGLAGLATGPAHALVAQIDVDGGAVTITTASVDNDIFNSQIVAGGVISETTGDILIGTFLIDGITDDLTVTFTSNEIDFLAAGNGAVITNIGGDIVGIGASSNTITIPPGSTDGTAIISTGQLITGETTASGNDDIIIGAVVDTDFSGTDNVAEVVGNDVNAEATANSIVNTIEGDLTSAGADTSGPAESVTVGASDVVAASEAGIAIANGQVTTGAVTAELTPGTGLIGVNLGDSAESDLPADTEINVSGNSLNAAGTGNEAVNNIDVAGGTDISRRVATGQNVNAGVNGTVEDFQIGLVISDVDVNDNAEPVTVNANTASASATGNVETTILDITENAADSEQGITNNQVVQFEAVSSTVDDLDVGVVVNDELDDADGVLDVEVLGTEITSDGDGNIATNVISLDAIGSDSDNDLDNDQGVYEGGEVNALIDDTNVGIELDLPSPGDEINHEIDLDISITTVASGARSNTAVNSISIGEDGTDSVNLLENDQFAENTTADTTDVNVGAFSADDVDFTETNPIDIDITSTEISATTEVNDAANSIVLGGLGDDTDNDLSNDQFSNSTAATVDDVNIGLVLGDDSEFDGPDLDVLVISSEVQASATGNVGDNLIGIDESGNDSDNELISVQASGDTESTVSDTNIGVSLGDNVDFNDDGASVAVTASSSDVDAASLGNTVDNDIALVGSAVDSDNLIDNDQSSDGAVTATVDTLNIGFDNNGDDNDMENAPVVEVLSNSVNATATGVDGDSRIAIGEIATDSTNFVDNDQFVNDEVTAEAMDILVGFSTGEEADIDNDDIELNVSSTTVDASALGANGDNSVILLGLADDTDNDIDSEQNLDGPVTGTVDGVVIGLDASADSLTQDEATDITALNNTASSSASGLTATNTISIDEIGVDSENDVNNLQIVDAEVTAETIDVVIGAVGGVDISLADEEGDGDATTVEASANAATSRALGASSDNRIVIAGNATDSDNDTDNGQLQDAAISAETDAIVIGLDLSADSPTVGADLTVTTSANEVSSRASALEAVNLVTIGDLGEGSTNLVDNNQDADADISSDTTDVLIGVSLGTDATVGDGDGGDTTTVTSAGNLVSSSTRGNEAVNAVTVEGTADDTDNDVINVQDIDTGASVTANTDGVVIGIGIAGGDITGDLIVATNANDVRSSIAGNVAGNSINLQATGDSADNDISNTQSLGDVTADVADVVIGAESAATIDDDITVTSNGSDVRATANGNSAENTIRIATLGLGSTNDIVSDQTNTVGTTGTQASIDDVIIGLSSDGDLDDDGDGGDVDVVTNGNNVIARSVFNAVDNEIDLASLGNGSTNAIDNDQTIDNTVDADVVTEVSDVLIGASVLNNDGNPTEVVVAALSNTVGANLIGNSASNVIAVDDLDGSATNTITNTQAINGGGTGSFNANIDTVDIGMVLNASGAISDISANVGGNLVVASSIGNTALNSIPVTLFGGAGSSTITNEQSVNDMSVSATLDSVTIGISASGGTLVDGTGSATASGNAVRGVAVGNSVTNRIGVGF